MPKTSKIKKKLKKAHLLDALFFNSIYKLAF